MTLSESLDRTFGKDSKYYPYLYWKYLLYATFICCYIGYLSYGIYYHIDNDLDFLWCDGIGFVIICTAITVIAILFKIIYKYTPDSTTNNIQNQIEYINDTYFSTKIQVFIHAILYIIILVTLIVIGLDDTQKLISVGGLFFFIIFGIVFSKNPRKINWRQVTSGIFLQFILALIMFRWNFGRNVIDCLASKTETFLAYSEEGSIFSFSYLVSRKPFLLNRLNSSSVTFEVARDINDNQAVPGVTAFAALSVLYFFSFFISLLFHFGVIQGITRVFGRFLEILMGTTTCESINSAANVFLGQTLSPLLIRPYLKDLTSSEIHAVITSGFATIAANVFAIYISVGADASFLIAASVMSAPAALSYAKLLYPETEESKTKASNIRKLNKEEAEAAKGNKQSFVDVATKGATDAGILIRDIVGILVAIVAFVAFLDAMVSFFASLVGYEYITFEWILGKVFTPVAWILGIDWEDCEIIGQLIGKKLILNEFIAYQELGELARNNAILKRSTAIATYAMCGFVNPASVGITLAVLTGICPERANDFSKVVFRAFVSATCACFMTACFAGALFRIEDPIIPVSATCAAGSIRDFFPLY